MHDREQLASLLLPGYLFLPFDYLTFASSFFHFLIPRSWSIALSIAITSALLLLSESLGVHVDVGTRNSRYSLAYVAVNRLSLIFDEGKYQPTVWGYEI